MKIENTQAGNSYAKQIEKLQSDIAIGEQMQGEVLLDSEKKPGDKELQAQLKGLDADLARWRTALAYLELKAKAFENRDKKAVAKEEQDLLEAADKLAVMHSASALVLSKEIDRWLAEGFDKIFPAYEKALQAAYEAGIDAGIPYGQLSHLVNLAPIGVALADRICRGGWTRLPFLDVAHPRDPATVEQMTRAQHESVLIHLKRAQVKRAKTP